jgi:hypothetical protein
VDTVKMAAAWSAEKLGRLKLNGRILGYSPLSRVVEIEALTLGVTGRILLWEALAATEPVAAQLHEVDLDELIRRARSQLRRLRRLRVEAAGEAFA